MANKQHAQFSDENGNLFYLENQTEDVLDPSGKPLSDGGDLSEASVKFSVDTSRKLPQSGGRFKAFLGSIVKYLTDLGAAAYLAVANNDTTTQPGFVGDARVLKQHRDAINQLSSELYQSTIATSEMTLINAIGYVCDNCILLDSSGRGTFLCTEGWYDYDIVKSSGDNCSGIINGHGRNNRETYSVFKETGADAVPKKLGNTAFSMTWHHNAQANVVAGLYSSIDLPGNYDTLQVTPKTVSPSNTTIAFKVNGETKQTITSAGATIDLSQYNADIIKLEIYDPYNGRVQVIADITLS